MKKLFIQKFYEYESSEESVEKMLLFRKFYCISLAALTFFELRFFDAQFMAGFYRSRWEWDYLSWNLLGFESYYWLKYLMGVFLLFAAFSFLPRVMCALALLCFLLRTCPLATMGAFNATILIAPTLFLFSLFDLRKNKVPLWVRDTFVMLLGTVYFHAALAKIKASGLDWVSGNVLELWMERYFLMYDSPIVKFLILYSFFLSLGAALVLIFEFTFFFALFRRFRPYFIVAGIVFHLSIFFLLNLKFFSLLINYFCFLGDIKWIEQKVLRTLFTRESAHLRQ